MVEVEGLVLCEIGSLLPSVLPLWFGLPLPSSFSSLASSKLDSLKTKSIQKVHGHNKNGRERRCCDEVGSIAVLCIYLLDYSPPFPPQQIFWLRAWLSVVFVGG